MLKTTDLGQTLVNLRHVKTDRQLIQEVYFHTVLMYTKFLFNSEERGKAHKESFVGRTTNKYYPLNLS